jgi:hypothetical protein
MGEKRSCILKHYRVMYLARESGGGIVGWRAHIVKWWMAMGLLACFAMTLPVVCVSAEAQDGVRPPPAARAQDGGKPQDGAKPPDRQMRRITSSA